MKVAFILLVCFVACTLGRRPWSRAIRRYGRCPDTSGIITTCVVTERNCFKDSDCGRGYKCCPRGCGKECLRPVYGR